MYKATNPIETDMPILGDLNCAEQNLTSLSPLSPVDVEHPIDSFMTFCSPLKQYNKRGLLENQPDVYALGAVVHFVKSDEPIPWAYSRRYAVISGRSNPCLRLAKVCECSYGVALLESNDAAFELDEIRGSCQGTKWTAELHNTVRNTTDRRIKLRSVAGLTTVLIFLLLPACQLLGSSSQRNTPSPKPDSGLQPFTPVSTITKPKFASTLRLTEKDYQTIGNQVRRNELGNDPKEITAWNINEKFASLGIGHFIWYPANMRQGFEESFPQLVIYLRKRGTSIPTWLSDDTPCPWKSRQEFTAALDSPQMLELRRMLHQTTSLQSHFLVERLLHSLPRIEKGLPTQTVIRIRQQYMQLTETARGTFALVDYVNFKGDGTRPAETYGEGWGLRQVLLGMHVVPAQQAPDEFGRSAERILRRRVELSPPEHRKGDKAALKGWLNRVHSY